MTELERLKKDYHAVRTPNSVSDEVVSRFSALNTKQAWQPFFYVTASIASAFIFTWVFLVQPAEETTVHPGQRISMSQLQTPNLAAISQLPAIERQNMQFSSSTGLINKFHTLSIPRLPRTIEKETLQ